MVFTIEAAHDAPDFVEIVNKKVASPGRGWHNIQKAGISHPFFPVPGAKKEKPCLSA
jgi:hypothetical protein